jgi:hypothetical protein
MVVWPFFQISKMKIFISNFKSDFSKKKTFQNFLMA